MQKPSAKSYNDSFRSMTQRKKRVYSDTIVTRTIWNDRIFYALVLSSWYPGSSWMYSHHKSGKRQSRFSLYANGIGCIHPSGRIFLYLPVSRDKDSHSSVPSFARMILLRFSSKLLIFSTRSCSMATSNVNLWSSRAVQTFLHPRFSSYPLQGATSFALRSSEREVPKKSARLCASQPSPSRRFQIPGFALPLTW